MQDQRSQISWREGRVPVSDRFDDPYYSLEDGLDETRHVFLAGNNLPERFRDGFRIAELGFGTGLNALAVVEAWAGAAGTLHMTSFEAYPLAHEDMAQALAAFPSLAVHADALLDQWPGPVITFDSGVRLELVVGDARETLSAWQEAADAWFLDGFAPARNPEMWEPGLMTEVAAHTRPGGTFATYTAAGAVRRALQEAGFNVSRVPGYGRKRHMTIGSRR